MAITNWYGAWRSTQGRWEAFLPPQATRRLKLYILRRTHHTDADGVYIAGDGSTRVEAVKQQQVVLEFRDVAEGDVLGEPTIEGHYGVHAGENTNDVTSFLQAMADLACACGITPSNVKDRTDELKATRQHLEDARALLKLRDVPGPWLR